MKIYVNERFLNTKKIDKNFKIVNLSDVHFRGDSFSKDIKSAIENIERINPNMISLTGDFIDSLEYGVNYKKELIAYLKEIANICPTFMSFGSHDLELFLSHESREDISDKRREMQRKYFDLLCSIGKNFYPIFPESTQRFDIDDNISVFGYSYFDVDGPDVEKINGSITHMQGFIDALDIDKNHYNILLCHGPLAFFDRGKVINDCDDFDLILAGHNHAGMIPHCLNFLPIGILGPDRRIFPLHVSGMYQNIDGTTVDISPGFLKVPGIVIEDIPFVGNLLYKANYLYSREMDLININDNLKQLKKMG